MMGQWEEEFRGMTFEQRLARGKQIMWEYAEGVRHTTVGPIALRNGLTMRATRDVEAEHIDLDELLLAIIGDEGLAKVFHGISKWYA